MDSISGQPVILITYTTLYREGGEKFKIAAETMRAEKQKAFPGTEVISAVVESKAAFLDEIAKIKVAGKKILELHFIGHSGMYGIMFGTRKWPEQMSPYEWRNTQIPFHPEGKAFFHACRTGRWFAPFFARTFNVPASGYFWYTTVSVDPRRFIWERTAGNKKDRYIISVPGKKSHGLLGSVKKFFTKPVTFPLIEFKPAGNVDSTYDSVAPLYDETFEDIAVRADELKWLREKLQTTKAQQKSLRVLDIGCGTGSFVRAISDIVDVAHGVDLSQGMVEQARRRSKDPRIQFSKIDGPQLPFPDNSFDVVTSVLSFRYLDWDPIVSEILRVLKPGGQIMIIDMVAAPLKLKEWPQFLIDKLKHQKTLAKFPAYRKALHTMVSDPRWKKMLEYNPIRSEHEMKWYLESRFPESEVQVINYAFHSRIVAFQSPPLFEKSVQKTSYP